MVYHHESIGGPNSSNKPLITYLRIYMLFAQKIQLKYNLSKKKKKNLGLKNLT